MQAPDWQTPPFRQPLPQLPQLVASVWRFVQPVGQAVSPTTVQAQAPPEQASPVIVHALPQLPQLLESVWRFVQAVPQAVSPEVVQTQTPLSQAAPEGQEVDWVQVQVPAWQLSPWVQALAQAPQFFGSVCRFTQAFEQVVSTGGASAQVCA